MNMVQFRAGTRGQLCLALRVIMALAFATLVTDMVKTPSLLKNPESPTLDKPLDAKDLPAGALGCSPGALCRSSVSE